jgi:hypothetical protein
MADSPLPSDLDEAGRKAGTPSAHCHGGSDSGCSRSLVSGFDASVTLVVIARLLIMRATNQAVELGHNEAGERRGTASRHRLPTRV